MEKNKNKKIILWGDIVTIKDLIISILISLILTMGMYFIAPADKASYKLFFGLAGAILAFIITSLIFKPKRMVEEI